MRRLLRAYDGPGLPPTETQVALVEALNGLLEGRSIYASRRFGKVQLTEGTRALIERKRTAAEEVRLNRLLLAEAYGREITTGMAPGSTEWHRFQIRKYATERPRYVDYAHKLESVLRAACTMHAPLGITQARAKSLASFGEKARRKAFKYERPLYQITDLCGARVITQTREEVTAISDFIKSHFEVHWDDSLDVSQRLRPTEFGYRSVHYVVEFKPGLFPTPEVEVETPEALLGLTAEIQVRTILEHAWADVAHEMTYKSAFEIPAKWERELATLAAMLENADAAVARIRSGLRTYASSYGAYMTEERMREEIEQLEVVLEHAPEDVELATRIGKLAITLGDWRKAIDVLSRYAKAGCQPALRDLGVAICKLYEARPESRNYRRGQQYLEAASAPQYKDADAIASLAGTWKEVDPDKARELYRQAYELDPSDPYPLANYLAAEVAHQREVSSVACMRPVMETAIRRCRDQAEVGVNTPWAFYSMGMLYLLLGKPYQALSAYCKAVELSTDGWMLDTSLRALEGLDAVRNELPGYEWVRRLLLVGWAARFPERTALRRVEELASSGRKPIAGPVVIVAGGSDDGAAQQMKGYQHLVRGAFRDYQGTIISGGTATGINGLVGNVQEEYHDSIVTIGYVPKPTPADAAIDKRYREIRRTEGDGFTPLAPLQGWIDLVASGIDPQQVKVVAIGGGAVAGAAYRIALALGARVGLLQGSGGEAAELVRDDDWSASARLLTLPEDVMTLRVFVGPGSAKLTSDVREIVARGIHESYQRAQARRKPSQDPSMAEWDKLAEGLKESNRQQADHSFALLRLIDCRVREVTDREVALTTFTDAEIETMAEMEHARWNVERLLNGWRRGLERDVNRKVSPYLVAWSQLPDEAKEWDRETLRQIPELLARVGLEIRRKP